MPGVSVTWLGHAAFRVDTPGGKRLYVDPWLDNPKCPEAEREPERDRPDRAHARPRRPLGGTVELAQRFGCPVIAQIELRGWLATQGLPEEMSEAMNKGGTVEVAGVKLTMTHANHSSSVFDERGPVYLGESTGYVIELRERLQALFRGRHERLRRTWS